MANREFFSVFFVWRDVSLIWAAFWVLDGGEVTDWDFVDQIVSIV
ncbi:hypothetical protein [Saccharibacter sp. 17.LH.SD]|nr:hypothetical protein [Saccharibacter sp. 17.LH.SD]